jgi:hypothetical protein
MYQELERVIEDRDGIVQERRMLQIEQMLDREINLQTGKNTAVKSLFQYWHESHRNGRLPSEDEFTPKAVLNPADAGWLSWVDVTQEDPFNFVLHDHPGAYVGDFSHKALISHPFKPHAVRCAFEYEFCKRTQQPIYHEITQTVGRWHRSYVRLLLPTVDKTGKIQKLFYATRYLTEPVAA